MLATRIYAAANKTIVPHLEEIVLRKVDEAQLATKICVRGMCQVRSTSVSTSHKCAQREYMQLLNKPIISHVEELVSRTVDEAQFCVRGRQSDKCCWGTILQHLVA